MPWTGASKQAQKIFSFLHEKIHFLTPQIKFLLTSRNISNKRTNLPSGIFVYKNPLFWENKLGDIIKYLGQNLEKNMLSEQYQEMLSCMGPGDNVQKLAELCGRNFLFLTHALEFWVKEGNVLNVPTNEENIYWVYLIRIFRKTENMFCNMRTILKFYAPRLDP